MHMSVPHKQDGCSSHTDSIDIVGWQLVVVLPEYDVCFDYCHCMAMIYGDGSRLLYGNVECAGIWCDPDEPMHSIGMASKFNGHKLCAVLSLYVICACI